MTVLNRYLTTSAFAGLAKIYGMAAHIGLLWLASRMLTKDDFGLFVFVFVVCTSLAVILASPFYSVILYRVSRIPAALQRTDGRALSSVLFTLSGLSGVIAAGLFFVFSDTAEAALSRPGLGFFMAAMAPMLAFDALRITSGMWRRACGEVIAMTITQEYLLNTARLVLMGMGAWMQAGPVGAAAAMVAAHGLTFMVAWIWGGLSLRLKAEGLTAADFAYGLKSLGSKSFDEQTRSLDQVIVGAIPVISTAGLADYALSSKIARLLFLPKQAVSQYMLPRMGQLLGEGDAQRVQHEYHLVQAVCLGLALLLAAFVCATGHWILSLFGDFGSAYVILMVLCAVSLFENGAGYTAVYLAMAGAPGYVLASRLLAGVLTIGAGIAAALFWGASGVALGVLSGVVAAGVLMACVIWRRDHVAVLPVSISLIMALSMAALLTAGFGAGAWPFLPLTVAALLVMMAAVLAFLHRAAFAVFIHRVLKP